MNNDKHRNSERVTLTMEDTSWRGEYVLLRRTLFCLWVLDDVNVSWSAQAMLKLPSVQLVMRTRPEGQRAMSLVWALEFLHELGG